MIIKATHSDHDYVTAAGLLGDKLSYLPGNQQEPLYDRRPPDNGENIFAHFSFRVIISNDVQAKSLCTNDGQTC